MAKKINLSHRQSSISVLHQSLQKLVKAVSQHHLSAVVEYMTQAQHQRDTWRLLQQVFCPGISITTANIQLKPEWLPFSSSPPQLYCNLLQKEYLATAEQLRFFAGSSFISSYFVAS